MLASFSALWLDISFVFALFSCLFGTFGAFLLRLGNEISHLHQVEASGSQGEVESDLLKPDMPELAEPGDDFGPAEELFDILPVLHALPVGCMTGGATVNRGPLLLAGDMRRNFEYAQLLDEVRGVIPFVGSYGDALCPVPLLALHHLLGGAALGGAIGMVTSIWVTKPLSFSLRA